MTWWLYETAGLEEVSHLEIRDLLPDYAYNTEQMTSHLILELGVSPEHVTHTPAPRQRDTIV